MGGVNTLVVLDSRSAPGAGRPLNVYRYWVEAEKEVAASLNLNGSQPSDGWLAVADGVVEVPADSKYKEFPVSQKDIWEDPLKPCVYRWSQILHKPVYWLILILPPGQTLSSANPEPRDAGILGGRFAVFWDSISFDQPVRSVETSWELTPFTEDDRQREVDRLRARLPLSEKRKESVLRRITFMKRGLGVVLLAIALIAAWLALPSGLAISPPHISVVARIPATVVFIAAAALSLMGLAKGWSLAILFVPAKPVRRRS
jgi:hypothetical protein